MPPSPGFTSEARENVDRLQDAVLAIEDAGGGDASAPVAEAFRAAHNLKGMAAMEGIESIQHLAHSLENVLDGCRSGTRTTDSALTDVLLEGIDLLGALVEAAEADETPPDTAPMLTTLSALVETPADAMAGAAAPPPSGATAAAPLPGGTIGTLTVQLTDACALPGARAIVVVRTARAHGEVLGAVPPTEAIRAQSLRRFVVAMGECADPVALEAAVRAAPDVASATWTPVPDEPPPPPASADQDAAPAKVAATIRVDVERLDRLADRVGELSIERNRLSAELKTLPDGLPLAARTAFSRLDRALSDLRSAVMNVRLVSLEPTVDRARRLVRDVARELGKDVRLDVEGATTEVDRGVVDELFTPIVHLLRNAVDHGIEPASARVQAGKPERGVVRLSAYHQGDQVVVEVGDDGAGIDLERVAAKAVRLGLLAPAQVSAASADELLDVMFSPGFSTREEVSEISGRGVGLDVVRAQVDRLGGRLDVQSAPGSGTTFRVRLPLSLAAMEALLVRVDGTMWAVPLNAAVETARLDRLVGGIGAVPRSARHRGRLVPVIWGREELAGYDAPEPANAPPPHRAIVFDDLGGSFALIVDELVESRELIVKPAPAALRGAEHMAGVTLLSNGSVAPIVDLTVLADRWRRRNASAAGIVAPATADDAVGDAFADASSEADIDPTDRAFQVAAEALGTIAGGTGAQVERWHPFADRPAVPADATWFRLALAPYERAALVVGFAGAAAVLEDQGVPSEHHPAALAEWANIVGSQFAVGGVGRFGADVSVGVPLSATAPGAFTAPLAGRLRSGAVSAFVLVVDGEESEATR